MKRLRWILLAFALCAADPVRDLKDLLREAESAVSHGDWESAERLYAEAEPQTADPGLVAFNKGVILYHRGNYRQAEAHLRRSLADAAIEPTRRTRGLFNLGDCLVKQAGDSDAKQLQQAIECYELVLAESTDADLKADAIHNLELTKLLWAKAITKQPAKNRDPEWENPDKPEPKTPPPSPKKEETQQPATGDSKSKPDAKTKAEISKEKADPAKDKKETTQKVPGSGSLKVLNDDITGPPLSAEDADTALKRVAERLRKERRKLREESSQGERFRPNDW